MVHREIDPLDKVQEYARQGLPDIVMLFAQLGGIEAELRDSYLCMAVEKAASRSESLADFRGRGLLGEPTNGIDHVIGKLASAEPLSIQDRHDLVNTFQKLSDLFDINRRLETSRMCAYRDLQDYLIQSLRHRKVPGF